MYKEFFIFFTKFLHDCCSRFGIPAPIQIQTEYHNTMGNQLSISPWSDILVALEATENEDTERHAKRKRWIKRQLRRFKRQRKDNKKGLRWFAPLAVNLLSDAEFKRYFRIYRSHFELLFAMLEPFLLAPNEEMAIRLSGSSITPRNKIYCTLRFLTGASYLGLMLSCVY